MTTNGYTCLMFQLLVKLIPCLILIEAMYISGVVNLLLFHYVRCKNSSPRLSRWGGRGGPEEEGDSDNSMHFKCIMAHQNSKGEHFLPNTDTVSNFIHEFIFIQQILIACFPSATYHATLLTTLPYLICTATL